MKTKPRDTHLSDSLSVNHKEGEFPLHDVILCWFETKTSQNRRAMIDSLNSLLIILATDKKD